MNRAIPFLAMMAVVLPCFVLTHQAFALDRADQPDKTDLRIEVKRRQSNPLITFKTSPSLGKNLCGPSVIKAPSWLKDPLGKYYMYFAHHGGKHIRLAYADDLAGPWNVYEPGVMHLRQLKDVLARHVASPDVHVDEEAKIIRMFFHVSPHNRKQIGQKTLMAESRDGILFQTNGTFLGQCYWRVFRYGGYYYAMDSLGCSNRSKLPGRGWQERENTLVPPVTVVDEYGRRDDVRIRHSALMVKGNTLYLFYSRKGDAPERILMSIVDLTGDWNDWTASSPIDVIRPQEDYEGGQYRIKPSLGGKGIREGRNLCQLRDPYVFEEDGRLYLFYSIAGERGIAMAEMTIADGQFHEEKGA